MNAPVNPTLLLAAALRATTAATDAIRASRAGGVVLLNDEARAIAVALEQAARAISAAASVVWPSTAAETDDDMPGDFDDGLDDALLSVSGTGAAAVALLERESDR